VHYKAYEGIGVGNPFCIFDGDETWSEDEDADEIFAEMEEAGETFALPSANRGWLHLSCRYNKDDDPHPVTAPCSASNAEINGWINRSPPFTDTIYAGPYCELDGDWIKGDPGSRDGSRQDLEALGDNFPHEVFYIPVFDKIYQGSLMEDTFGDPGNLFSTTEYWYHIINFVGVRIDAENDELCPGNKTVSGKFVKTTFDMPILPPGGDWSWEEPGACDEKALTVTLWR
jgi:hypothetical protein